jgi:hypothetical protein
MRHADLHETTILDVFPCAIEYDDHTALTDDESQALESWLSQNQNEAEDRYGEKAQVYYDYGESKEFALCDVTDQRGPCVKVKVYVLY